MAKSTHDKQLERARRRRAEERAVTRRATTLVVSLVAVLVVGAVVLGGVLLTRGNDEGADLDDTAAAAADRPVEDTPTGTTAQAEPCPSPTGTVPTPVTEAYGAPPTADLGDAQSVTVTIRTTCGDITLELDAAAAPGTVGNFVALAEDGYYDGVPFHRVIDDFMIQGGDPTGTGTGCVDDACTVRLPGYDLGDELALAEQVVEESGGYPRGVIAMANTGRPDSAGSQFFIVQAAPSYPLPPTYAVFGAVTDGMAVVDRIALGPVESQLALDPVVILGVDVQR